MTYSEILLLLAIVSLTILGTGCVRVNYIPECQNPAELEIVPLGLRG